MKVFVENSDKSSMSGGVYLNLRKKLDELISNYQIGNAKKVFSKLKISDIPTRYRADLARLARRVNMPKYGAKLLHQNIYELPNPSQEDILEYAACIRKLGLINQCIILLDRLEDVPEKYLYKSFCYMQQWDYEKAKACLVQHLKFEDLTDRQRAVGHVNLISALLSLGEYQEAHALLDEIEGQCEMNFFHLYLNCLELRGQAYYFQDDVVNAIKVLKKAQSFSSKEEGVADLFVNKWLLLAKCRTGSLLPISQEISDFKKTIRSRGHWETLRDFDWHLAKISNNSSLLNYVYMGTPQEGFRNNARTELPNHSFPAQFLWMDGREKVSEEVEIDLYNSEHTQLPLGMGLHRLWMLLASDFYRAWSVSRIFDALFPDEVFNPDSSSKKVYRLVDKLQKHFEKYQIPMSLKPTVNGYRLRPRPGGLIYVHNRMVFSTQEDFFCHRLSRAGLTNGFSVEDLQEQFSLSQHQVYRLLKKMKEQNLIESENRGKFLVYSLKAS